MKYVSKLISKENFRIGKGYFILGFLVSGTIAFFIISNLNSEVEDNQSKLEVQRWAQAIYLIELCKSKLIDDPSKYRTTNHLSVDGMGNYNYRLTTGPISPELIGSDEEFFDNINKKLQLLVTNFHESLDDVSYRDDLWDRMYFRQLNPSFSPPIYHQNLIDHGLIPKINFKFEFTERWERKRGHGSRFRGPIAKIFVQISFLEATET